MSYPYLRQQTAEVCPIAQMVCTKPWHHILSCLHGSDLCLGDALALCLYEAGFSVSVVNPAQVKAFAKSLLSRNKTDEADARLIARFCQSIQPMAWQPLPLHIRQMQAWVRRLEALQDMQH